MEELISIIVPVYNAQNFIAETIESVLAQSETGFELLLVNDFSTDDSVKVIKGFTDERIRLIEMTDNFGAYAARNKGLSEAKGRYIAFLDSDDLWDREKLKKELAFLKENDADMVFTGYEFADVNGIGTGAIVKVPKTISYKEALHNTTIFTSTVMIDRNKVPDSLIEMPNIKSEDTATWWAILKAGHSAYGLNENLVKYRRSTGSLSANKLVALKRIWNLYRKVAKLSVPASAFHFVQWAVLATLRRI